MKQEYIEKIMLTKEYLSWDESLDDDTFESNADKGFDMMLDLVKTKDTAVLIELFGLFNERTEWYGGVCERLLNSIWDTYEIEQIIEAISKKFYYLVENDVTRAVQFVGYSMNLGYFDDMRRIFNETKSKYSAKFLDKFGKWYMKDYLNEIALLREDMKKW